MKPNIQDLVDKMFPWPDFNDSPSVRIIQDKFYNFARDLMHNTHWDEYDFLKHALIKLKAVEGFAILAERQR